MFQYLQNLFTFNYSFNITYIRFLKLFAIILNFLFDIFSLTNLLFYIMCETCL